MNNAQLAEIFERRAKSWDEAKEDEHGATREMMWWISCALIEIADDIRALPVDPLQIENAELKAKIDDMEKHWGDA